MIFGPESVLIELLFNFRSGPDTPDCSFFSQIRPIESLGIWWEHDSFLLRGHALGVAFRPSLSVPSSIRAIVWSKSVKRDSSLVVSGPRHAPVNGGLRK